MAELMKHIDIHVVTDFIDVSSYHGGTESTGTIIIKKRRRYGYCWTWRNYSWKILLDTGRTLKALYRKLIERKVVASVTLCFITR